MPDYIEPDEATILRHALDQAAAGVVTLKEGDDGQTVAAVVPGRVLLEYRAACDLLTRLGLRTDDATPLHEDLERALGEVGHG